MGRITTKKNVRKLVSYLADNHVNNSSYKRGLRPPSRNVLIIGAGLSNSAFPHHLPTGGYAAKQIEDALGLEQWTNDNLTRPFYRKYEEIKTHQQEIGKASTDSFEEKLARLQHFVSTKDLINMMTGMFNYRTFPSISCELIAHLLKNRYVDIVINYNFDEILDQAILEELGPAQKVIVLDDGDCKEYKDLLLEDRLHYPVYIKPHGTIKSKSSLRFTKDQYLQVPEDIMDLIGGLLSGEQKKNKTTPPFGALNLIPVGFAMESIEFNLSIQNAIRYWNTNKNKPTDIKLNFFPLVRPGKNQILTSKKVKALKHRLSSISTLDKNNYGKIYPIELDKVHNLLPHYNSDESKYLIEKFFLLIDSYLREERDNHPYNASDQHQLRIELLQAEIDNFNDDKNKTYASNLIKQLSNGTSKESLRKLHFNTQSYYKNRFIVELYISLLKNKGYVDIEDLIHNRQRTGYYFDLYYLSARHRSDNNFVKQSLRVLLKSLGLSCLTDKIPGSKISQDGEYWGYIDVNSTKEFTFSSFVNRITLNAESEPKIVANIKASLYDSQSHIYKLSNGVFNKDASRIYPNFDDSRLYIFEKIKKADLLLTESAFQTFFKKVLTEKNLNLWDSAIFIVDFGLLVYDFLSNQEHLSQLKKSGYRRFAIVVSNTTNLNLYHDKLKRLAKALRSTSLDIDIFYLPPNTHNDHSMAFFSQKKSSTPYLSGVYYHKRGLRNRVNAVRFFEPKVFGNELSKAKNYKSTRCNLALIYRSGLKSLERSVWLGSFSLTNGDYKYCFRKEFTNSSFNKFRSRTLNLDIDTGGTSISNHDLLDELDKICTSIIKNEEMESSGWHPENMYSYFGSQKVHAAKLLKTIE